MTDLDPLFAEYVAEHQAGRETDPREYLARVSRAERAELAALIDAYLARATRESYDPAVFRGSSAKRIVDELERAIAGQRGLWPALLPRLRDRAGLKRIRLSSAWRPRSACKTARRRSPATTTRWNRDCSRPRASRTGCSRRSDRSSARPRRRLPLAEDQANLVAAAALMPARLVQEQYARCERDVFRLCETFAASGAAMGHGYTP